MNFCIILSGTVPAIVSSLSFDNITDAQSENFLDLIRRLLRMYNVCFGVNGIFWITPSSWSYFY